MRVTLSRFTVFLVVTLVAAFLPGRARATITPTRWTLIAFDPPDGATYNMAVNPNVPFSSAHGLGLTRGSTSDPTSATWIFKNGYVTTVVCSATTTNSWQSNETTEKWVPQPNYSSQTLSGSANFASMIGTITAFFKDNYRVGAGGEMSATSKTTTFITYYAM